MAIKTKPTPYRNRLTGEVRYMNDSEYGFASMKALAQSLAHSDYINDDLLFQWEPVEDTPTLKLLYGTKKGK